MDSERAAAKLGRRDDNLAAIGLQDADRCVIELGETDLRNTAREKCDASAAGSLSRKGLAEAREEKVFAGGWHQAVGINETEQAKRARGSRETLQAGMLVETNKASCRGDARGIRQQAAINDVARYSREKRPTIVLCDLAARRLDQLAVFDSRGTRGFASAAIEAGVHVMYECIAESEASLIHKLHLADAAAG